MRSNQSMNADPTVMANMNIRYIASRNTGKASQRFRTKVSILSVTVRSTGVWRTLLATSRSTWA